MKGDVLDFVVICIIPIGFGLGVLFAIAFFTALLNDLKRRK